MKQRLLPAQSKRHAICAMRSGTGLRRGVLGTFWWAAGPTPTGAPWRRLQDDTRAAWQDCLAEPPDDGLAYAATAQALKAWIARYWEEWYEQPIAELQHRASIRDQALGIAYAADPLDLPARYEVHLDRKLERMLAMLIRLRDLRQPTVSE